MVVQNAAAEPKKEFTPYTTRIRPGTDVYDVTGQSAKRVQRIQQNLILTIVEERVLNGTKYGRLKSGIGWVILETNVATSDNTINRGDTVSVIKSETYDGKYFHVYEKSYKVLRVTGDRVVISSDGKNVTAAVKASNLKKL